MEWSCKHIGEPTTYEMGTKSRNREESSRRVEGHDYKPDVDGGFPVKPVYASAFDRYDIFALASGTMSVCSP